VLGSLTDVGVVRDFLGINEGRLGGIPRCLSRGLAAAAICSMHELAVKQTSAKEPFFLCQILNKSSGIGRHSLASSCNEYNFTNCAVHHSSPFF
jgi:hypothetical protein